MPDVVTLSIVVSDKTVEVDGEHIERLKRSQVYKIEKAIYRAIKRRRSGLLRAKRIEDREEKEAQQAESNPPPPPPVPNEPSHDPVAEVLANITKDA